MVSPLAGSTLWGLVRESLPNKNLHHTIGTMWKFMNWTHGTVVWPVEPLQSLVPMWQLLTTQSRSLQDAQTITGAALNSLITTPSTHNFPFFRVNNKA